MYQINTKFLRPLILFTSIASSVQAGDFGLGLGTLDVPHYMGSRQNYQVVLPFPFYLEEKDNFYKETGFIFDVDANLTLPVSGDDPLSTNKKEASLKNYDRRGMGYIAPAFYLGVKAGYQFGPVSLEANITPGVQLGHGFKAAGTISKVTLTWAALAHNSAKEARCLCFKAEALYTNNTFNQLFYNVDSDQVLADRSEYDADKSGFLGSVSGVSYIQRVGDFAYMFFLNYSNMDNSVVEKSPLVKKVYSSAGGFGVAYIF